MPNRQNAVEVNGGGSIPGRAPFTSSSLNSHGAVMNEASVDESQIQWLQAWLDSQMRLYRPGEGL